MSALDKKLRRKHGHAGFGDYVGGTKENLNVKEGPDSKSID